MTGFYKFLEGAGLTTDLNSIKRQEIELFLLHLQKKGQAPDSVLSMFSSLRAFFNWCKEEELIASNPVKNMHPPKIPHRVAKPFLPDNAMENILKICPANRFLGARNWAMIQVLWTSGMRLEECANIRLPDMEWDRGRIKIFGKGARERWVPFMPNAKKALWRYLEYRNDKLPELWLSGLRTPTPMTYVGVKSTVHKLMERAGYGHMKDKAHIFRRTWAMRQIRAGIPTKSIQLVGGWENLSTLEIYIRAMESEEALNAKWV